MACLGEDEKADFISPAMPGWASTVAYPAHRAEGDLGDDPADSPNGERPALYCGGASDALFVVKRNLSRPDCRFLHHGGTGLLAAMDQGQSARLLQAAKRASHHQLTFIARMKRPSNLLRPLLPSVDYFGAFAGEAAFLSGETQPEATDASSWRSAGHLHS